MTSQIKYIFCINTGRSGSKYLAEIFSHSVNCISLHEPEPKGNNRVMRRFLNGDVLPMQELCELKFKAVQSANTKSFYVETNHCFIKGWGWFIADHIPQNEIGVIVLHRNKKEIVTSLMRVLCSPLLKRGRDWMICPNIKAPFTQPPVRFKSVKLGYLLLRFIKMFFKRKPSSKKIWKFLPTSPDWICKYEEECCDWYVNEISAMTTHYKRKFPDMRYYDVNIKDLNSIEGINKMLNYFGVSAETTINKVVNKKVNTKSRHKK